MPITKKPSSLLTKEQKEIIAFLYGTELKGLVLVQKKTGVRRALIQRYLIEVGIYRHRYGSVYYFPEPENRMWSKHEEHYGRNGANLKYTWDGLSETEQAMVDEKNHDELKQF